MCCVGVWCVVCVCERESVCVCGGGVLERVSVCGC